MKDYVIVCLLLALLMFLTVKLHRMPGYEGTIEKETGLRLIRR